MYVETYSLGTVMTELLSLYFHVCVMYAIIVVVVIVVFVVVIVVVSSRNKQQKSIVIVSYV
jgi:heme/copper-type cytochrome/quinol oxidase subunit 2